MKPMENIVILQQNTDDTPNEKHLKRMVLSLVNESCQSNKKVKILNQKIRKQYKSIVTLKSK